MKAALAQWMRKVADRLDHEGAPKIMHWSFTFENREGIRFREDGKGCPLAYLGDSDYERAHSDADRPAARVPWRALAEGRWPDGLTDAEAAGLRRVP